MTRDVTTPLYIVGSVIAMVCCFSIVRCGTRRLGIELFAADPEYEYTPVMVEELRVERRLAKEKVKRKKAEKRMARLRRAMQEVEDEIEQTERQEQVLTARHELAKNVVQQERELDKAVSLARDEQGRKIYGEAWDNSVGGEAPLKEVFGRIAKEREQIKLEPRDIDAEPSDLQDDSDSDADFDSDLALDEEKEGPFASADVAVPVTMQFASPRRPGRDAMKLQTTEAAGLPAASAPSFGLGGEWEETQELGTASKSVPKLTLGSLKGSDTGAGVLVPRGDGKTYAQPKVSASQLFSAAQAGKAIPWDTLQRMGALPNGMMGEES